MDLSILGTHRHDKTYIIINIGYQYPLTMLHSLELPHI